MTTYLAESEICLIFLKEYLINQTGLPLQETYNSFRIWWNTQFDSGCPSRREMRKSFERHIGPCNYIHGQERGRKLRQ
jgi:hypothetical protein